MSPYSQGMPITVTKEWLDELTDQIHEMRLWLSDLSNIDAAIEEIADVLVEKHHDYGEANLADFGELGILVRASDKVARLKNLLDKPGAVKDESREDTWRDLAGYAIQALIMMKRNPPIQEVDVFEIRKDRLIRGFCPDCGEGVVLRRQQWVNQTFELYCSEQCGFVARMDMFGFGSGSTNEIIHTLAAWDAKEEQKL